MYHRSSLGSILLPPERRLYTLPPSHIAAQVHNCTRVPRVPRCRSPDTWTNSSHAESRSTPLQGPAENRHYPYTLMTEHRMINNINQFVLICRVQTKAEFVELTASVLGDTKGRVCAVQDGTTFTNTLLSDGRADAFLIIITILTGPGLACVHARLIFFTGWTFESYSTKNNCLLSCITLYSADQRHEVHSGIISRFPFSFPANPSI